MRCKIVIIDGDRVHVMLNDNNSVEMKGGDGSGNFDHEGIPGQKGGSLPATSSSKKVDNKTEEKRAQHNSDRLTRDRVRAKRKLRSLQHKYDEAIRSRSMTPALQQEYDDAVSEVKKLK